MSVPLNDGDRFLHLCKLQEARDSEEDDSKREQKWRELDAELHKTNTKRLKQLLNFEAYKDEVMKCLAYGPLREGFKPSRWDKLMSLRMVEVIRNLFLDIASGWDTIVGKEYAQSLDEVTFETLSRLTPKDVEGTGIDLGLDKDEHGIVYEL